MVNICMLSVSDSSPPAKLKAAPTDLKVKVFGVLVGVCGIFGVLVGVWYSMVRSFVWYFIDD